MICDTCGGKGFMPSHPFFATAEARMWEPCPKCYGASGIVYCCAVQLATPLRSLAYQRAQQDPSIYYIDIRNYGTVEDGGDITAAFQAALNFGNTHRRFRIIIPRIRVSDGVDAIGQWSKCAF